ncbi:MAG: potassium channel family protein [bacterium]|nr:potassium channel family protein [bacterium]
MFGCILVGSLLSVLTVGIHALGTAWWIGCLKRTRVPHGLRARKILPIRLLCTTALLLLLLHITEVIPWSLSYMLLPGNDGLASFEQACYFATVTFSALGYGDIVIQGPWRMLSAIQAMTGLLVFGWSTALLFAVVERIWGDRGQAQPEPQPQLADAVRQRPRVVRSRQLAAAQGVTTPHRAHVPAAILTKREAA